MKNVINYIVCLYSRLILVNGVILRKFRVWEVMLHTLLNEWNIYCWNYLLRKFSFSTVILKLYFIHYYSTYIQYGFCSEQYPRCCTIASWQAVVTTQTRLCYEPLSLCKINHHEVLPAYSIQMMKTTEKPSLTHMLKGGEDGSGGFK